MYVFIGETMIDNTLTVYQSDVITAEFTCPNNDRVPTIQITVANPYENEPLTVRAILTTYNDDAPFVEDRVIILQPRESYMLGDILASKMMMAHKFLIALIGQVYCSSDGSYCTNFSEYTLGIRRKDPIEYDWIMTGAYVSLGYPEIMESC